MTLYGYIIWVNIGSGNGLLPDGTKPLPEPMLTCHQLSFVTFPEGGFTEDAYDIYAWYQFQNYWFKITASSPRGHLVNTGLDRNLGAIVLFHKSQCALRYLDLMSKIQNTSSQCSLATWLTVTANEQNGDWPAPVSRVSVQPVIGWLKYEVARQWSHIVHRPRPHGNVPLPMRS